MADEKGASLAERMEAMRLREAGEASPGALERAIAAKDSVQSSNEAVLETLSTRLRTYQEESIPEGAAPEEAPKKDIGRLLRWFAGNEEEVEARTIVTPIGAVEEGWDEVEFYPVDPPFSFVRIEKERLTGEMRYRAIEPPLEGRNLRILQFVTEALVRGLQADPGDLDAMGRREYLLKSVRQIIKDYGIIVNSISRQRLEYFILKEFLGFGRIEVLMRDTDIEDISCDGQSVPLFVFHRRHEAVTTTVQFDTELELDGFVIRMAQQSGKSISVSDPVLDAALPDGSRLQATLGREVTENGSTFTIRRFRPDPFSPTDLVRFGTMSADMLAWFWLVVEAGQSLVFSGGTASGKTTSLNAICQFMPGDAKVVSIEDTREVNLPHQNWIKAVTRQASSSEGSGEIGMFELLKAALRQRPEYILVGEVRGIEATVAFQAMATGHTVFSTMHADSARSVVYRLENEPINIPRLVLQTLDVIAIQAQVRIDGKRQRRIREVVELVGMDPVTRELLTNKLYDWDAATDEFVVGPRSYMLERIARERNWTAERMRQEHQHRAQLLSTWRDTEGMTLPQLTAAVRAYDKTPDVVLKKYGVVGAPGDE